MAMIKMSDLKGPSKGFTLLEMFLVVAVMAAIGFVAARHYVSVSASSKANETVLAVNHIHAATASYSQDQGKQPSSVTTLVSAGYLASNYEKSPWGGSLSLGAEQNGKYTVSVNTIPTKSLCQMIYNRLKGSINPQSGEAVNYSGSGCSTVVVTYLAE